MNDSGNKKETPFIRIVGEVDRAKPINPGDTVIWHLSIDPIVPRGPKKGFFYKGRIVDAKSGRIVKQKEKTEIAFSSNQEDFERLASATQGTPIDYQYIKLFEVNDLPAGEYRAQVEMYNKEEIVSVDTLSFLTGVSEPILAHRIKLPDNRGLPRIGDVNGDGRMELVWTCNARYQIVYDNDGDIIWEYHDEDGARIYNTAPVRVYDINGDGKDEIITMRGKWGQAQLCIIEGATGEIINQIEWPYINQLIHPDPGSDDYYKSLKSIGHAHRVAKHSTKGIINMYGAKIVISNLQGNSTPMDFIVTVGEQNCVILVAYNNRLEKLWDRKITNGTAGHTIWVGDVNGDGKDEVAVGTMLLDSSGNVMWEKTLEDFSPPWEDDHIDGMKIADVDGDGRIEIIYTCRVVVDALTGEIKWKIPTLHGQDLSVAKMRDDVEGQQIIIDDRFYRHFGSLIYGVQIDARDCHGQPLWHRNNMAIQMHREIDWDGDGKNEIIIGFDLPRRPHNVNAGIFDGYGRLIGVLPRSGFGAKFVGRKSDDLISWTQWSNSSGMLEIYSNGKQPLSTDRYCVPKVVYNEPD